MEEQTVTTDTQTAGEGAGAIATPPADTATPPASDQTTDGAAGGAGEGGEGGAITAPDGNGGGDNGGTEPVDYSKMTDDEYLGKVQLGEGQEWNKDAMKAFAPLLRENGIPPEVFAKFVAKDAELAKEFAEKQDAETKRQQAEAQAAFKQAGEDFRKEFTPEQVKEMNETMATLKDDQTFVTLVARSPLANNKTMGRMLLAYRQVYGEDNLPGTGAAEGGKKGFAEVWTGRKV